ncbi:MAG: MFS transporter [Litorivicinaceae bacterium]
MGASPRVSPTVALTGIILAQLLGCTLWFSVNGVAESLILDGALLPADLGQLTAAVQIGFITGTLVLGLTGLADHLPAPRLFAISAVIGALLNLVFIWVVDVFALAVMTRFAIGVCLAGIYPLGMKLIVSWSPDLPGFALGLLVGMLTLGTALPHGLAAIGAEWPWHWVLLAVSGLALGSAGLITVIGEGPYGVPKTGPVRLGAILKAFQIPGYRGAAFGYFGHMWELYAFWLLVPWLVAGVLGADATSQAISGWSFAVIAAGTLGAIWAGWLSRIWGSARLAFFSLFASGALCLVYPWLQASGSMLALAILLAWGFFVVADSAQFSALSAKACAPEDVGSALALQNSMGFAISVGSILWVSALLEGGSVEIVWWLLIGPLFGLIAMRHDLWRHRADNPR